MEISWGQITKSLSLKKRKTRLAYHPSNAHGPPQIPQSIAFPLRHRNDARCFSSILFVGLFVFLHDFFFILCFVFTISRSIFRFFGPKFKSYGTSIKHGTRCGLMIRVMHEHATNIAIRKWKNANRWLLIQSAACFAVFAFREKAIDFVQDNVSRVKLWVCVRGSMLKTKKNDWSWSKNNLHTYPIYDEPMNESNRPFNARSNARSLP